MARGHSRGVAHVHHGSTSTSISSSSTLSTSASAVGFDASKQGTIPAALLHEPPRNEPAVVIRFVNAKIGLGVFAARYIPKGEFIFHERPVITAAFNELDSDNKDDMRVQVDAVSHAQSGPAHLAMDLAFPRLIAELGHVPCGTDTEDVPLEEIGINLVHGMLQPGLDPSIEDYREHVRSLRVAENPSRATRRNVCRDFFKNYAFQVPASQSSSAGTASLAPSKACVYLLGSLINHCCPGSPGPNCEFQIGPGGLAKFVEKNAFAVRAVRDIKEGKQLTISYGKQHKGFHCQCKTCERKPHRREELCVVI